MSVSQTMHPLRRDGTSQTQRLLPALDPAAAPIDDRDLADLLVFAHAYAGELIYFNETNTASGHWQPFFDRFPVVQAALIAKASVASLRAPYQVFRAALKNIESDPAARGIKLGEIAGLLIEHLLIINHWGLTFDEGSQLGDDLRKAVGARLRDQVIVFIEASKAFLPANGIAVTGPLSAKLRPFWEINPDALPADETILAALPDDRPALFDAVVKDTYQAILQTRAFLIERASAQLEALLTGKTDHEPHLGLLLAFLKLYAVAQDQLNDLTRRHLDFYYARVLGIRPRDPVPDTAYLLFELAKHLDKHRLEAGILFKAGKDATGKELSYALDDEVVLSRAVIGALKNTFVDSKAGHRVHAAAVANSADGLGEPLPDDDPQWLPFGGTSQPEASLGFALASPVLELTGGKKTIVIELTVEEATFVEAWDALIDYANSNPGLITDNGNGQRNFDSLFSVSLTGPEGWITPSTTEVMFLETSRQIKVTLSDLAEDASVVPWTGEIHGRSFDTDWPVVELLLNRELTNYPAAILANLVVNEVGIRIGVAGDKCVLLANDAGDLNPAKPFQPFGAAPAVGSSFYIGSREIFSKQLTSLNIALTWKDKPAEIGDYYRDYNDDTEPSFQVDVSYLDKTNWATLQSAADLFTSPISLGATTDSLVINSFEAAPELEDFSGFNQFVQRGFVRLTLVSPSFGFGHKEYPILFAQAVVAANGTFTAPNSPYTPTVSAISLDYESEVKLDLLAGEATTSTQLQFFHVEPHGEWSPANNGSCTLIPSLAEEGQFFIGFLDAAPGETVSVLFRAVEGSGDPFVDLPELKWHSLGADEWTPLPQENLVKDETLGFTRTGIIVFTLPTTATTENTRLPAGLLWLRASVSQNSAAISRLLTVTAQAGSASFQDSDNDPDHLASPLPAGTIAKLRVADKAVKTINQPDDSAGGKPIESGQPYYLRVSERLRHKGFAVTLWDYERLVLENFPEVYKAKCVTHSREESELAPGCVLVTVIPDLNQRSTLYPFKPAVSQATLKAIADFLTPRISAFVQLKVINPLYEEVKVTTTVVLRAGYDAGFYAKQLDEDIKRFLAPWAYDSKQELTFGGRLHRSVILNAIEERPYIDYLLDFSVTHSVEGTILEYDAESLVPTTAHSIFIPADANDITVT